MVKKLITVILILLTVKVSAQNISLDLQSVNISDALKIIARSLHKNVIIQSNLHAAVTLHLKDISANELFNMLLHTHGLIKINIGNTWYITQRNLWMEHEQDQLKFQEIFEATTPLVTRIWQMHYAKVEDIFHMLQEGANSILSKRGRIKIDVRTNTLFIQDTFSKMQHIQQFIKQIDVPVQQVLIEAHLASVDSDFERSLGMMFVTNSSDSTSSVSFSKTRYGLLVAKLADSSLLEVQLSALENSGHGHLISSPRLFTANHETAAIESGEEIPYQQESPSGGTSVVFKKAVLSLKVTPQILPGKKVLLELEINQDKPGKLMVQGVPAINTRQMKTNVLIQDGQTVVLGGIYETDQEGSRQAIPFLSQIPVIGLLFQQRNINESKRELLIFVTPRIVH